MIRSFGLLNGKPISESSRSTKSRQSIMFPFLIRSWNASSGRFAVSIWTGRYSGRPLISKTSCSNSRITTTAIARITHCRVGHQIRTPDRRDRPQISAPTDGNPTAVACIKHLWLPDISKLSLAIEGGTISASRSSQRQLWVQDAPCVAIEN
jgi:hypothetical protein